MIEVSKSIACRPHRPARYLFRAGALDKAPGAITARLLPLTSIYFFILLLWSSVAPGRVQFGEEPVQVRDGNLHEAPNANSFQADATHAIVQPRPNGGTRDTAPLRDFIAGQPLLFQNCCRHLIPFPPVFHFPITKKKANAGKPIRSLQREGLLPAYRRWLPRRGTFPAMYIVGELPEM
jgi:hypothetical protein